MVNLRGWECLSACRNRLTHRHRSIPGFQGAATNSVLSLPSCVVHKPSQAGEGGGRKGGGREGGEQLVVAAKHSIVVCHLISGEGHMQSRQHTLLVEVCQLFLIDVVLSLATTAEVQNCIPNLLA